MESIVFKQKISGYVFPNMNSESVNQVKFKNSYNIDNVAFASKVSGLKGLTFIIKIIKSCQSINFYIFNKSLVGYFLIGKFKNVVFCENMPILSNLYRGDIDCFIVPSVYESYSMIASEALKFNKKVIVWNSCGISEQHAENSLLKVIKAFDINNFIDAISNNKEFKRELLIPNTYKECSIAFFYSNKKDTYFETFSSDNVDKYFQELADIIFSKGKFFAKENFFYRLIRKINKFTKNINNWSSYGLK